MYQPYCRFLGAVAVSLLPLVAHGTDTGPVSERDRGRHFGVAKSWEAQSEQMFRTAPVRAGFVLASFEDCASAPRKAKCGSRSPTLTLPPYPVSELGETFSSNSR